MTSPKHGHTATESGPIDGSVMGQGARSTANAQLGRAEDLLDLFACQRRLEALGRSIGRDAK
jgi:hypothetical protein